jgi:hypothetical protein
MKKNSEQMTGKTNELETNVTNKEIAHLYRGINEFMKGYWYTEVPTTEQLRHNI